MLARLSSPAARRAARAEPAGRLCAARPHGATLAEGRHRGPGTPHAEADALGRAGRAGPGRPPPSSPSNPATTPAAPGPAPLP